MFNETKANIENLSKGAYVLTQTNENPDVILIATGSEVSPAGAKAKLEEDQVSVRIVAMPSWELFDRQSNEYKESVLPSSITKRVSLEMGVSLGWERYVGQKKEKYYQLKHLELQELRAEVMNLFGFDRKCCSNYKNVLNFKLLTVIPFCTLTFQC